MKTGLKKLDIILRNRGLLTPDAIGTVLSIGDSIYNYLKLKGYNIEQGLNRPTYDYVVVGKSKISFDLYCEILTKLNSNSTIVIGTGHGWKVL